MKRLHLKDWVKDLLFGTYFGLAIFIGIMLGLGIW